MIDASSTPVSIEVAGPEADDEIEEFVNCTEGALVYYTPAYRRFLCDVTERAYPLTLVARDTERIVGMLPAFVHEDEQYGGILNSLPFFGSHGGALVDQQHQYKDAIAHSLYKTLAGVIDKGFFSSVTVVENPFQPISVEQARLLGCAPVDDRIGQFTSLPQECEDPGRGLFEIFHQKTRNAVRKGQSLNLRFDERTDMEALAWLQKVHEESIMSLGGVPKSLSVFRALAQAFGLGKEARLFFAYDQNVPVSAVLLLVHRKTVEYFTPVVTPSHRNKQALSALIFHCMCTLAREGFQLWNWGGTWRSQTSVYRFKSRWGATERTYRYFNSVLNDALFEREPSWIISKFPWFYVFRFK